VRDGSVVVSGDGNSGAMTRCDLDRFDQERPARCSLRWGRGGANGSSWRVHSKRRRKLEALLRSCAHTRRPCCLAHRARGREVPSQCKIGTSNGAGSLVPLPSPESGAGSARDAIAWGRVRLPWASCVGTITVSQTAEIALSVGRRGRRDSQL
jgi:hypothetical protein